MKIRINSCGVSDCAPDWKWITSPAGLPDYDLWAVFRGVGTLTPAGDDAEEHFHIREGACLLLTPEIPYAAEHDPARPLLVVNVHFDFLDEGGKLTRPTTSPIAKSVAEPAFFKSLLMRTVTLFNSNKAEAASVFFSAALEEFQSAEPLGSPDGDNPWVHIVHEICGEIDRSKKAPSLAELSMTYGYSERYIGKIFKKITGLSFSEYAINSRISKAKTLLQLSDAPVEVIAEETGFYDASHFTRCFGKITGMSPVRFRRQK